MTLSTKSYPEYKPKIISQNYIIIIIINYFRYISLPFK